MSTHVYNCEDCDWKGVIGQMGLIQDVEDRVAVGELMAAGQCPECGSLIGVADADVPDYTVENCVKIATECGILQPSEHPLITQAPKMLVLLKKLTELAHNQPTPHDADCLLINPQGPEKETGPCEFCQTLQEAKALVGSLTK